MIRLFMACMGIVGLFVILVGLMGAQLILTVPGAIAVMLALAWFVLELP